MEVEVQKSACNFVEYDFFPNGTVWAHFAHIGYNSIVIQLHRQNMEYASTQIQLITLIEHPEQNNWVIFSDEGCV